MIKVNKRNKQISDLLKDDNITTKIKLYFSTTSYGEDYDSYENNTTLTLLNPITIKAYVREISPESLVWREIGSQETGAKEIICEDKYGDWFRKCAKIEIDNDEYEVYRERVGNRVMITKRPFKLLNIVIRKK